LQILGAIGKRPAALKYLACLRADDVAEARQIARRQTDSIERLKAARRPTREAEQVLYLLQSNLRILEEDLAGIAEEEGT
jgi:hypothetical protein